LAIEIHRALDRAKDPWRALDLVDRYLPGQAKHESVGIVQRGVEIPALVETDEQSLGIHSHRECALAALTRTQRTDDGSIAHRFHDRQASERGM